MIELLSRQRREAANPWRVLFGLGLLLCVLFSSSASAAGYRKSNLTPPSTAREFRGVWIATVANIDWPSRPGLSTAAQKAELTRILDRAVQLRLNAVILQVRPACDALYASALEPWSEYLTGRMGRAPSPFYDPLAFAVSEAHQRGLELHAWFNPYRALHFSTKSPMAHNHVSKTRPELVRHFGRYLWLDPGEPAVQDYSLNVVMDVVRRYDIDAVHFDDYFYPDPVEAGGAEFPDDASWKAYRARAGPAATTRDEWRRRNVNTFIERVYRSIKSAKPWVKFGISPRGIWRPGHPPQIKGTDAYAALHADSRKWLANGWLDYFAPQLYWPIGQKEQSFPALLSWWAGQNAKGRHLWPGLNTANADKWAPGEIADQIELVRKQRGSNGYLCYNASSLMRDAPFTAALERSLNNDLALVPASNWLSSAQPDPPALFFSGMRSGLFRLSIGKPSQESKTRWWLIQTRFGQAWRSELLPGAAQVKYFDKAPPDAIAVTRIDKYGNVSIPIVFEKNASP